MASQEVKNQNYNNPFRSVHVISISKVQCKRAISFGKFNMNVSFEFRGVLSILTAIGTLLVTIQL